MTDDVPMNEAADETVEQEAIPGVLAGIGEPVLTLIPTEDLPDGPQLPNDELIQSVQERGVLIPPIVFQKPDEGSYYVASGSRTIMAARQVGIEAIWCNVYGPEDWQYYSSFRLTLNSNRSPSPIAELDSIMALMTNGATEDEIAAHHGMTSATVRKRLSLANLTKALTTALQTNTISLAIAERCARLNREQMEMAEEILAAKGKLTSKDINQIIVETTPPGSIAVQEPLPEPKDWRKETRKAVLAAKEHGIPLEALLQVVEAEYTGDSE